MAAAASSFGIIGRFFGNTVSEAAAFAAGVAIGPVLGPPTQALRNTVNAAYPFVPVRPETAAAVVAEDVEQRDWGITEASYAGVDETRFDAILGETLTGPGIGPLYELWRRGLIGDGDFIHGLRKAKLEGRWDGPLQGLRDTLLSSEELANLQQQGFVEAGRANEEGALQGVTAERQQLRFEASGLPPGIAEGLTLLRRGIIDEATFRRIVREGHTKTKYTDALLALRQTILSATEYATLYLKGWVTKAERDAGGALSGHTPAQMEQLFLAMGRPAAPVQMQTAWARGIHGPDGKPMDEAQFLKGIRESDIRPEWGPMLWGIRHAYPSLFQLRGAVQSGAITPARALTILRFERYEDQDAQALVATWSKGTAAGAKAETKAELQDEYAGGYLTEAQLREALGKLGYRGAELDLEVHLSDARRVKRWREKAVDAIAKAYIAHDIDDATALVDLAAAGVAGEAAALLLPYWQLERRVARKHLTAAQVKKAYTRTIITRDQAVADLILLGYTAADAGVYLDE